MKKPFLLLLFLLGLFRNMQVSAEDIPFREQRREIFRVLPVNEESIVFLGNSITNFNTWPEAFGSTAGVVNRGISGNYSGEVLEHLDLIVSGHPKKIFLMIGINDYQSPEVVIPNTKRIIDVVRRESPETTLYIQSLLPCNRADRKGMVEPINKQLKELCEKEGITFINLYPRLVDDNAANPGIAGAYTNDNLHVTAAGYREWTKDYEQYTGIAPSWSQDDVVLPSGFVPFENIMISEFCMLPVNDGDILMLGDYNVQTGEWAELMQSPKVKNRGIGIGWGYSLTLDKLKRVIPYIIKGNPSKIFLQCGARDLGGGTSADDAYTKYIAAVEDIKNLMPEADIYLQSIIPFTDATLNTEKVVPFNEKIKAYAEADNRDKVQFVDVYTALSENGVLNTKFVGANTAQSRGINGRGYLRWAATLAPFMGEDIRPVPELSDAAFALNEALSAARRKAFNLIVGDEPGHYDEEASAPLREAIATAETLLSDPDELTDKQAAEQASLLEAAAARINEHIVLPHLSTDENEVWYKLSTPLRSNLFTENEGLGSGAMGKTENNNSNQQWKFTLRTDNTWNIISRADGGYLSPEAAGSAQLQTVKNEPAKGWTLQPASTLGYFIAVCGTAQLHQTNASLGYKIINWGGGTNTTDDGCQFRVTTVTTEPDSDPEPEVAPDALLTLTNITLDGTSPYKVPEEMAAPVLAAESATVAIDFTLADNSAEMALVGSSNSSAAENFVCVSVASANNFGVRYNNGGGKYTQTASIGTNRHRIVVTMQPVNPSCSYYLDETKMRDVAAVVPTLGNVSGVDGLYLGGLVCSDNANKYPMHGTIHSVQFFPGVLTPGQVEAINYDGLIATSISGIEQAGMAYRVESGRIIITGNPSSALVYDMTGRQHAANDLRPGLYLLRINGKSHKIQVR